MRFSAKARLAAGMPGMPCTVIDMTIHGAQIVAENIALPNNFTLLLDAHGAMTRTCKVMSRDGFTVGVRFVSKPLDVKSGKVSASSRGLGEDAARSRT